MFLKFLIFFLLAVYIYINRIFPVNENIKTAFDMVIIIVIGSSIISLYREKRKIDEQNSILKNMSSTYDDLDEQTRITIKTDLELSRAREELDKKMNNLETLHSLTEKTNVTINEEQFLDNIMATLNKKIGFEKCIIILFTETNKISSTSCLGYADNELFNIQKEMMQKNLFVNLFSKHKFIYIHRIEETTPVEKQIADLFNLLSLVFSPIKIKDNISGFICAGYKTKLNYVSNDDAELIYTLASQIGISVENARLYEELWNSHRKLEEKVLQRTKELELANQELKNISQRKTNFVSAVSHELRTPLTSIKGYTNILLAGKLGAITEQQYERLKKIDKHTNSLTHLINELLDIARIESGREEMLIKENSITEVINNCLDIITPQAKDKDITLETELPSQDCKFDFDSEKIHRVIINLLSNSVKYTPKQGSIFIKLSQTDKETQVDVKDNGLGIPKDAIPKLFDEFYRVTDNRITTNIQGAGLGLSLVKKIIDAHNGKIWVQSSLSEGSTFSFVLPNKQTYSAVISENGS